MECMRVDRSAQGQMKHHFPLWTWMMDKGLQPAEFDEGGEAGLENCIKNPGFGGFKTRCHAVAGTTARCALYNECTNPNPATNLIPVHNLQ